ncbi:MAG: cysteine desulfurase family protein, partial [Armatimonadota bacterium]
DDAREKVAALQGARAREVVITSGGTGSDNLAIKGIACPTTARRGHGHIITSQIEHHAVLHPCQQLERCGFEVTYLPVDKDGLVDPESVRQALRDDTILVTIMHANNEVGTIEPIAEIGEIVKERGVTFHTDAVQTVGHIPTNVDELHVDLLSLSAHKFYGPRGVGALYIRRGVRLAPLLEGGGQERNLWSGTENVAGIVGLARALELAVARMDEERARLTALRDRLIEGVINSIPSVRLTGHRTRRLPNSASFCMECIEGESMVLLLDSMGICASSGSACTSGSLDPSHVLLAMGLPHEIAHGSLRLTLGKDNTDADVDRVLDVLPGIVQRLREMSPLWTEPAAAS